MQDKERLQLQAQQLEAQLAQRGEEAREGNLRIAQLEAALEEKTQALEAAEVRAGQGIAAGLPVWAASMCVVLAQRPECALAGTWL